MKKILTHVKLSADSIRQRSVALIKRVNWGKVVLFFVSLLLFVYSVLLMKEGADALGPLLRDNLIIRNNFNSLGFGWLFAYFVLSGSPVATAALTLLDAQIIGPLSSYLMIIGSRLGASFIVLFLGFIYVLRGRDPETSLGMGFLSLAVTAVTNLGAMLIGIPLLGSKWIANIEPSGGERLSSALDAIYGPLLTPLVDNLPGWSLFVVGLVLIVISFNLFDRCLPTMTIKQSQVGRMSRLVYRPWVMFMLGAFVTVLSMSVSVSLAILVPLSARGFVRRENVIPYIFGANVTTFIDTLVAAILLDTPAAFTVVLVCMLSIAVVSVLIMSLAFEPFEKTTLGLVSWLTSSTRNMVISSLLIVVIPVILLLV